MIIGPKDLPKVIKQVTSWVRYLRGMTRGFQSGIDDMVRDSDLDEARKALDFARDVNPKNQLKTLIDPDDDLERDLDLEGQLHGDYDDDLFDETVDDADAPQITSTNTAVEATAAEVDPTPVKTEKPKAKKKAAPKKKVATKKQSDTKAKT